MGRLRRRLHISGEGGRWAGNETLGNGAIDALGPTAYFDDAAGTAELIPLCHRSKSAMIHIGGGIGTLNLACSGATTNSSYSAGAWKPGLDFVDNGGGQVGQAQMLEDFATDHDVEMVVMSIGGNDFHFGDIVSQCVTDFLKPTFFGLVSWLCSTDDTVLGYVSDTAAAEVQSHIATSISNLSTAMANAGEAPDDWTLVVNLYPRILPAPAQMRYGATGYERQTIGGCGFTDPDLLWAMNSAFSTINDTVRGAVADAQSADPDLRVTFMDTTQAFTDRELCSDSVHRVNPYGTPSSWQAPGAADQSEWVDEINIINTGPHFEQESLHPNYWGQLALRNCLRQVFNDGEVTGGTCWRDTGLNALGEPNMSLIDPLVVRPPASSDDSLSVTAGETAVIPAPGVLGNDADVAETTAPGATPAATSTPAARSAGAPAPGAELPVPEGAISAHLVDGPAHGELELRADGSLLYLPDPGFVGTDTLTYVARDFYAAGEPTTVTLTVTEAPADTAVVVTPRFTG